MSNTTPLRLFPLTIATAMVFALFLPAGCSRKGASTNFASPEEGVQALIQAVKGGKLDDVIAIFGAEGKELIDSSDPATARQNQQVFLAATSEHWRLEPQGTNGRVLVIGKEAWPFPVPLVRDNRGWHFDTAAGKEEIIARRIGRNELAAIRACRTYVAAQRLYAERGHDGKPAGLFAATFRSDPGRENGLYWPAAHGQKRSPLGDLVAGAAEEGRVARQDGAGPTPFHGYYFRILTAQGPDAPGGAVDYVVDGNLSRGFALVASPAQYDVTGVMTFIINQEGIVREKDLGPAGSAGSPVVRVFNPDASWAVVQ
jgi:hypothetical protein